MTEIINSVVTGISTVGFPIACCAFLLWQNSKQDEYHKESQEKLQKAIDNNSKSIAALQTAITELTHYVKGE